MLVITGSQCRTISFMGRNLPDIVRDINAAIGREYRAFSVSLSGEEAAMYHATIRQVKPELDMVDDAVRHFMTVVVAYCNDRINEPFIDVRKRHTYDVRFSRSQARMDGIIQEEFARG